MPKPSASKKSAPKKRRQTEDVNEWAFRMVRESTQEAPPEVDPSLISQVMAELGRRGGKKGGKKRMAMLTPKERSKLGSDAPKPVGERRKKPAKPRILLPFSLDMPVPLWHTQCMNKLSIERRSQIISALVEGNSILSTCRMTGAAKRTVTRLLVELGAACLEYQKRVLRSLPCQRIQCDEIWSFVGAKQKNVTPAMAEKRIVGDTWVWVAIDAQTKLVPSWFVGKRDADSATDFIQDLASRLSNRVQLTRTATRFI